MATTVKLSQVTKLELDLFKESRRETYEEVISKLIYVARNAERRPSLSAAVVRRIEAARKRAARGETYSEEEARKILGL
jgi:hypothetical protein